MQLDLLWYYQAYNKDGQFATTTLIKMAKKTKNWTHLGLFRGLDMSNFSTGSEPVAPEACVAEAKAALTKTKTGPMKVLSNARTSSRV